MSFTLSVPEDVFAAAVADQIKSHAWSAIQAVMRDPGGALTKRLQQIAAQAVEDVLADPMFAARLRQIAKETTERALAERIEGAIKRLKPEQVSPQLTIGVTP